MTYYLRTKENKTILDVELWVKDNKNGDEPYTYVELSSVVDIGNYSILLLEYSGETQIEFINDFDQLSELRGWMWESFFMIKKNTEKEIDNVKIALMNILKPIAEKYDLMVVQD